MVLMSHIEFQAVRSKIQANPEYLGEMSYIRLLNPQYKVKILVHHPPATGTGKWYQVSAGKAVGVFSSWCVSPLPCTYHTTNVLIGDPLPQRRKVSVRPYSSHIVRGGSDCRLPAHAVEG